MGDQHNVGDQRNYAALEWVLGEIGETLNDARHALESYVENPKDATQLRFCVTHIHQVRGSLQIVEFYGASMLAEEMENLAQSIMDGEVSSIADAQEVLMRSLVQLPIYLDRVKVYRDENVHSILPLLNDIRAVRKKDYLTEGHLFLPDLSKLTEIEGSRHPVLQDTDKLKHVISKLREMYQFAAASVLRDVKVLENLSYIEKVFGRLVVLTSGTPCGALWRIASAFIQGIKSDDIELSIAVQGLLRYLARELRLLAERAPESFFTEPRQELTKNLLYYLSIARPNSDSTLVAQIRARYKLDNIHRDKDGKPTDAYGSTALDPEAVRSVVLALREELKSIKSNLDTVLQSQLVPSELAEILPIVKRVGDTLAVLGIGELREKMLVQLDALGELSQRARLDEGALMLSAGDIMDVDSKLEAIAKAVDRNRDIANINERSIEIDEAKLAVIQECQVGLEKAKEAIIEYISSKWDSGRLENVDSLLFDISGGLDMIPLPRAAAVVNSCSHFITQKLSDNNYEPTWQMMDSLADAMASVEFFLERLSNDMSEEVHSLLDIAEDSVRALGMEPSSETKAEVEPLTEDDENADTTADNLLADDTYIEEPAIDLSESFVTINTPQTSDVSASPDDIVEGSDRPETSEQIAAQAHATEEISEQSVAREEEVIESDIDEEIIEIFIEEAGEVLETLHEHLPLWLGDINDQESRSVVRRAFHTLKGSGRMVEAMEIGELAWAIENMLNRVIDSTVEFQSEHGELAQAVLGIVPAMISAFEHRRPNPEHESAETYARWAFSLADGKIPEGFRTLPLVTDTPSDHEAAVDVIEPEEQQQSLEDQNENDALIEIFRSEVDTHLQTIQGFIEDMEQAAPIYSTPSDALQRALHTLKGSAKMAQVSPIANMYEALESFAKELVTFQVTVTEDIVQLIKDASKYTRSAMEQLQDHKPVHVPKLEQFLARTAELREMSVGHLVRMKELESDGGNPVDPRLLSIFMAEEMKLLLDADKIIDHWCQDPSAEPRIPDLIRELKTLSVGAEQAKLPDMASLAVTLGSAYTILLDNTTLIDTPETNKTLQSGHDALLDMVDAVAAGQNVEAPPAHVVDDLNDYVSRITRGSADSHHEVDAQGDGVEFEHEKDAEPITEIALETLPTGDVTSDMISGSTEDQEPDEPFIMDLHDADNLPLVDAEDEHDAEVIETITEDNFELVTDSEELVIDNEELVIDSEEFVIDSEELVTSKHNEEVLIAVGPPSTMPGDEHDTQDTAVVDEPANDDTAAEVIEDDLSSLVQSFDEAPPAHHDFAEGSGVDVEEINLNIEPLDATPSNDVYVTKDSGIDIVDPAESDDFDQDILEVFLEECDELFEDLDEAINRWETEQDSSAVEEMKRALHTMKGGARLSGLNGLGNVVHDYESYLIEMNIVEADEAAFKIIHDYQDQMFQRVNHVKEAMDSGSLESFDEENFQLLSTQPSTKKHDITDENDPEREQVASIKANKEPVIPLASSLVDKTDEAKSGTNNNVVPFKAKAQGSNLPELPGSLVQSTPGGDITNSFGAKKSGPQEVVRVNSDLLEELVNLAGETSISRSRLEEQVTEFRVSLEEIDGTIDRLQEQLRRLDIETQAQILFRQEQLTFHDEAFDPLEMDRYSQLQQLSRSLIESASDLYDLRSDLSNKVKDAETTLLQQSRINTTLQEGLMRSRMVPFSRLVPRLRRIVRQVAVELGKKVAFELDNVEGELDRNVLERMVPPFEHMLRNAVDHGIEDPEERVNAGKSESGRIVLTLGREGGNVSIRLADDGRGVNLERVRAKAIERGLMKKDADLSDHDIMQFILHAGFSTAESVTQISGRGVGMDVVHSEIKQLGGDVTINSEWGKGTEFVIHLPFTLSVNRALMVAVGQDRYAIPLNAIEGIVRISPFELEHYYSHPESEFAYANENFKVRYLGSMLHAGMRPNLENSSLPLPIVLVRTAQHTMALQVDELMGSREIVVKTLGAQFSAVLGLAGATIMGDGSVVIILDPHALVRQEIANADLLLSPSQVHIESDQLETADKSRIQTVMVVDDSVTVRKVTTRFLEREGYNVITAKDGVDALRILHDGLPDLMLLDIEMPRMDGFEVAKTIRTTQRWKHLPIIMITSRTGTKHREHAESLGVNKYMGKPYQEDVLSETIRELVGANAEAHAKPKQ